jgi:hypothetical protein
MIRRRRRLREIPFSLDSFLDVVANVVGIIIRLILVAWVGARTYSSLNPTTARPAAPASASPAGPVQDPLEGELARRRRELEQARDGLLSQLRALPPLEEEEKAAGRELAGLQAERERLTRERGAADETPAAPAPSADEFAPTLAELGRRGQQLREEIAALEKLPPVKKVVHYRVPISRPVDAEELQFECRAGRVSYLDFRAFRTEMENDFHSREDELRRERRIEGVTTQSGAFRMRYFLELSPYKAGGRVDHEALIEPVVAVRGEPAEAALTPGSEFHKVIDPAVPRQTVVTFWVYPDSFALFRRLRDYLYDHHIEVVAARLLLSDDVIGQSTLRGSKSRGQ